MSYKVHRTFLLWMKIKQWIKLRYSSEHKEEDEIKISTVITEKWKRMEIHSNTRTREIKDLVYFVSLVGKIHDVGIVSLYLRFLMQTVPGTEQFKQSISKSLFRETHGIRSNSICKRFSCSRQHLQDWGDMLSNNLYCCQEHHLNSWSLESDSSAVFAGSSWAKLGSLL